MNGSFSYIVTTFNAIHTRVGKIIMPLEKFPKMEISTSSFLHVLSDVSMIKRRSKNEDESGRGILLNAERCMQNAERQMTLKFCD